jgi:hypothetical protein
MRVVEELGCGKRWWFLFIVLEKLRETGNICQDRSRDFSNTK